MIPKMAWELIRLATLSSISWISVKIFLEDEPDDGSYSQLYPEYPAGQIQPYVAVDASAMTQTPPFMHSTALSGHKTTDISQVSPVNPVLQAQVALFPFQDKHVPSFLQGQANWQ